MEEIETILHQMDRTAGCLPANKPIQKRKGNRMGEIRFDKKLAIKTMGIKEWDEGSPLYHRCEPTPYSALEQLFRHYTLDKTDALVDFGSGKGRVAFYIHHRFHIPVVGIEAQYDVLIEALENKRRYKLRSKNKHTPITFEYGLAEHYQIKPQENKFFFFNPFSAEIFRDVLENITASLRSATREADVILYYPMPKYKKYMKNNPHFELHNKIMVPKTDDRREKFIIYRYVPDPL